MKRPVGGSGEWGVISHPHSRSFSKENAMRALLLTVSICLLLTSAAPAQQPTATPDSQQASAQSSTAPVPVPEPSEKAVSYYRSGVLLWIVNVVWGLLIPALCLFTGFSARIRDWARKGSQIWFSVISKIDNLFNPEVILAPVAWIGRTLCFFVG